VTVNGLTPFCGSCSLPLRTARFLKHGEPRAGRFGRLRFRIGIHTGRSRKIVDKVFRHVRARRIAGGLVGPTKLAASLFATSLIALAATTTPAATTPPAPAASAPVAIASTLACL
jgi:hypothetical protein